MNDNLNVWKNIYNEGRHLNRYPYDSVVTFIYRNYPRDKKREHIKILEVGCGAGNNLWFAAKEGFQVAGIDISESAINYAKQRFKEENLKGEFCVSDFTNLPFKDNEFDLVIDRCSITYVNLDQANSVIKEIKRVMKNNGKIFFNPYSDKDSSCATGTYDKDGSSYDIHGGYLKSTGKICFYGRRDIYNLFDQDWNILSIQHCENIEQIDENYKVNAYWRVIAEKNI